ncbi:MAG: PD-(D/E)XK nuclease family protein [Bacteroidales bacterium]|nr:PD-(D/E)XK nuclease family protein [Bacteroidales bacterium]
MQKQKRKMTFLRQLAQTILQRDDITLKDTLIVLPNKRARRMLQQELAAGISKPCFSPTIFSIDEFIHKLSDYTLCDDIELLHILFQAYQQFEHAHSEKLASFLSWAETFIHDISEIDMQLADASRIFGNLSDIKELETVFGRETLSPNQQRYLKFYSSLHELYLGFNSFLDKEKLAYEGKIYKDVAEHLLDYAPKFKFKRYIFAGFQTLSPSEMALAQYYHQEHQAEFYFDIDDFYRSNYTPFINILQNKLKLKDLNWIHQDYASIPKEIFLVGASKSMNQIFYAIEQLNRIEKEEGSLNNTVLVFADEKLLIPFIHCYDCSKANLTMGYPLAATPAYALLASLISSARNGQRFQSIQQQDEMLYYHRDVFSFFRNPLIVNYLFSNAQQHGEFIKDLLALNSILYPRQALRFPTNGTLEAPEFPDLSGTPADMLQSVTSFFELLQSQCIQAGTSSFDQHCLSMIIDGLQEAMRYLQHFHTDTTDLESAVFIINHLIQRNSIPLKGSPSEGLQIMGLLETRTLDFKNVIMLSVNEGTLPAGRSSNSLILHEVKRYFDLPTYQEKDTVYGYHFFRLLQRAEQIHILYNTDSDTSLAEKSRFLKQLDFEINAQHLSNIQLHELVLPTMVSSEQQNKEFSIAKTDAIVEKLLNMEYTYSQLNNYLNCPLQFYLKHVAKIEPAEDISESVEQKLIGNAIHDLLDEIGQQLIDKPTAYPQIIGESLRNIDDAVEKAMRKAVLQEHKNSDENKIYIDLSRGKSFLATEVVKKAVTSYLNKLKEDFEQAEKEQYSFKILATEQKLTATVNVDKQPIKLKGFADRIDLRKGLVTLLDYKTGYVDDKGLKCDDLSDIFTGTEHKQLLQLLMYAYLFDRGQETGDRVQDTGYSDQGTANEIQNPKSQCPKNCQLSTVNYSCGIISFQRLYKKEQHELYPTFQLSGDSNQETGDRIQGTDSEIQNPKSQSPKICQLSTVNCQLGKPHHTRNTGTFRKTSHQSAA